MSDTEPTADEPQNDGSEDEVLPRKVPTRGPSATSAPLNTTAKLLPPAVLKSRYEALASLARTQADSAARAGNVRLG